MLFINKKKIVGNEYPEIPMTLEQVIKANPNVSIPAMKIKNLSQVETVMDSLGYEICKSVAEDIVDLVGDSFKGKKLVLTSVTKKDGEWVRNYKEEAIPDADLERFQLELRRKRNNALRHSDWTQFSDSPLSEDKKDEWKVYRQELRDLPEKYDHPTWCNYPATPAE